MQLNLRPNRWRAFLVAPLLLILTMTHLSTAIAATPDRVEQDSDVYLPLVMADPCIRAEKRPQSVFGVQMYGRTDTESAYFDEMVESNSSWVRNTALWRSAAPENVPPDQFRWGQIDAAFAASAQAGINMIGTINFNPDWAADSYSGPIHQEYLDEFAQFTRALVERYDGDGIDDAPCGRVVRHWEFYNEPDGNTDRWGNDGDRYAEMLAAVYPAMKAADPQTQVLFGGMAYDWFEDQGGPFVRNFLTDVLDAGGGAYFDMMSFHVYPAFGPNWTTNGPGLYEKAQVIQGVLADYGLSKPMVITEAGAHSNADPGSPSTPEIQASYVIELFTQAKAANIDTLIWFMLYDPPEAYPHKNGLVTTDSPPQRKLAFQTFRLAVDRLAAADYDRQLADDETGDSSMLAYRFVRPDDGAGIYVAWMNPVDTEQTAALSLPGEEAVVYDIFSNARTVRDGDDGRDDGRLSIVVGGEPLMIHLP